MLKGRNKKSKDKGGTEMKSSKGIFGRMGATPKTMGLREGRGGYAGQPPADIMANGKYKLPPGYAGTYGTKQANAAYYNKDAYESFRNMHEAGFDKKIIESSMKGAGLDPSVVLSKKTVAEEQDMEERRSRVHETHPPMPPPPPSVVILGGPPQNRQSNSSANSHDYPPPPPDEENFREGSTKSMQSYSSHQSGYSTHSQKQWPPAGGLGQHTRTVQPPPGLEDPAPLTGHKNKSQRTNAVHNSNRGTRSSRFFGKKVKKQHKTLASQVENDIYIAHNPKFVSLQQGHAVPTNSMSQSGHVANLSLPKKENPMVMQGSVLGPPRPSKPYVPPRVSEQADKGHTSISTKDGKNLTIMPQGHSGYNKYKVMQIDGVKPHAIKACMEDDGIDPVGLFGKDMKLPKANPWIKKYSKRYRSHYYQHSETGEVFWRNDSVIEAAAASEITKEVELEDLDDF